MPRDQVFISYSHEDTRWREELEKYLKPYLRVGSIKSWSDKQINPGSQWRTEIETALTNTKVAVLLVTADFIVSDFIHQYELGAFLKEAKQGGVRILWVPVRASAYERTALKDYQAVLDPAKPLANMGTPERAKAWVKICKEIEKAVKESHKPEPIKLTKEIPIERATKEYPWVNSLGMKFVPVAGTQVLFSVWDTRVQDFEAFVADTNYDRSGACRPLVRMDGSNGERPGGSRVLVRDRPIRWWESAGMT